MRSHEEIIIVIISIFGSLASLFLMNAFHEIKDISKSAEVGFTLSSIALALFLGSFIAPNKKKSKKLLSHHKKAFQNKFL